MVKIKLQKYAISLIRDPISTKQKAHTDSPELFAEKHYKNTALKSIFWWVSFFWRFITITKRLPRRKFITAVGVSVFLVLFFMRAAVPARAGFFSSLLSMFGTGSVIAISGETTTSSAGLISMPLIGSRTISPAIGGPEIEFPEMPLLATLDSALVAPRNPLGTIVDVRRDQIVLYTVQPGDVPSVIAYNFGISLNTLLWANNIKNPNLIKVGHELVILPVSGIQYKIKDGDTLSTVAKKFKGDVDEILSFNELAIDEAIQVGDEIIIPGGEIPESVQPRSTVSQYAGLPSLTGYYLRPISGGRKSRGIHGYNAVDLANSCGLPIYASQEGKVIVTRYSGWNGGYGKYVVVNHPNETQTLYSHMSAIYVTGGQYVTQGQQIGEIGTTGNSTGCHIHFEVRGARNPF